jgi:hypothetical protein
MTFLNACKTAVEILAPAFTDHDVVTLRIPIVSNALRRGRGYWRMNVSYMHEATWNDAFAAQWAIWQSHKRYYPNEVWWWWWWCRYVKPMIKKYFIKTATTHRHDRKQLKSFYCDFVYDLLKEPTSDRTYTKPRHLKGQNSPFIHRTSPSPIC